MNLDYDRFSKTLNKALSEYGDYLKNNIHYIQIYAVGLYTNDEFTYFTPAANYRQKNFDFGSEWMTNEWLLHCSGQEIFDEINNLILGGMSSDFSTSYWDKERLIEIIELQLGDFRKNYFNNGCTLTTLFTDEFAYIDSLSIAKKINPKTTYENYIEGIKKIAIHVPEV